MRKFTSACTFAGVVIMISITLLAPARANAHCDTMDGPVVKAAKKALETGDLNLVLIWVQQKDEAVIKEAFEKTLNIRKLNPETKEFADMYFFETLVRIHRAGEGAPYTGLRPAGTEVEPGIEAADKAIESGSSADVLKNLPEVIQNSINEHFRTITTLRNFNKDDVEAGRKYVRAYVEFIHYVDRMYQAATGQTEGHYHESESLEKSDHR